MKNKSFSRITPLESGLFQAYESHKNNQSQRTLLVAKDNKELKYLSSLAANLFDKKDIVIFDHWQTLAYDDISPSLGIINQRIESLYRILNRQYVLIITPLEALIRPVCQKSFIAQNVLNWKKNDRINLTQQLEIFEKNGYQRVSQVHDGGEFAIRGSIVDLFLVGAKQPYRIDLFDSEIDSIRTFNVETQKTIKNLEAIKIFPTREFDLNKNSSELFKRRYFEVLNINPPNGLIEKISKGNYVAGLENYLTLFSNNTSYLTDYIDNINIFYSFDLKKNYTQLKEEISNRYQYALNKSKKLGSDDEIKIPLPSNEVCIEEKIFYEKIHSLTQFHFINHNIKPIEKSTQITFKNDPKLSQLKDGIKTGIFVVFTVSSISKAEQIRELLISNSLKTISSKNYTQLNQINSVIADEKIAILFSHLAQSLEICFDKKKFIFISEYDFFQTPFNPALLGVNFQENKFHGKYKIDPFENHFELIEGCCVVHEDYGIGKYLGLEKLALSKTGDQEYLKILYANNSKIFVPVSDIGLIGRYKSSDEGVELSQIGSKKWQSKKKKAAYQIKEMAIELLASQAKRMIVKKNPLKIDEQYQVFANQFPYEETLDQAKAIQDVLNDLSSDKPMNRLISGDVGFGKTEVAMRAAFVSINASRQVIVLTPTTLLNQQHYENFLNRFSSFAINVGQISRLLTEKQNKEVLEKFSTGEIDILIATHKVLSKPIKAKNLGLMVIDEEHRFGVSQKEKIKKMRADIDVLTMTATPIPRTLNMAMNRLQDISIIASPPQDRLSCKTVICQWDDDLLKQACMREIHRAGQIYWLHNNIATIYRAKKIIQELVPNAKIAIAHGQMNKEEIDRVMYHFYHQNIDILLCTTIIETGIDIANANTIIINQAHELGLSQLYQLRGRVGRSHQQAYAFLITEDPSILKKNAKGRLEAMKKANYLGAGFELASYDLEIRGSGDFLGKMQSGNIQGIGLDLYQKLLKKTIHAINSGEEFNFDSLSEKIDLNLPIDAYLPENYVQDVYIRLVLYKKIAEASSEEKINEIYKELLDRFGTIPEAGKNLLDFKKIKIKASQLGIKKISANDSKISFELLANHKLNITKVINLVHQMSKEFKLNPKGVEYLLNQTKKNSLIANTIECLNLFNDKLLGE